MKMNNQQIFYAGKVLTGVILMSLALFLACKQHENLVKNNNQEIYKDFITEIPCDLKTEPNFSAWNSMDSTANLEYIRSGVKGAVIRFIKSFEITEDSSIYHIYEIRHISGKYSGKFYRVNRDIFLPDYNKETNKEKMINVVDIEPKMSWQKLFNLLDEKGIYDLPDCDNISTRKSYLDNADNILVEYATNKKYRCYLYQAISLNKSNTYYKKILEIQNIFLSQF